MRSTRWLVLLGAAILVIAGSGAALAAAPPRYLSSSPGDGQEVSSPPSSVSITFDQPLDSSSEITAIEDHCGNRVDDGSTQVTGNQMSIGMDSEAAGTYHVMYFVRGVGGVTGQQQGMFMFTVTDGPSCGDSAHHHGGMGGMHMGGHGHGHGGHGGDHKMHMGNGSGMHDMHMGDMSMGGHEGGVHHDMTMGGHTHEMDMGNMGDMGGHHSMHHEHPTDLEPLGITSTGGNGDVGLDRAGMATLLTAVLLALALGAVGGTVLRFAEQS
ncbi:MAG TPA: copper resistance protein CopC [Actinomycetota bacterium]|nr:copper resistance protein CopC [Actinomycetota bacterium]